MGGASWSSGTWDSIKSTNSTKSTGAIFSSGLDPLMNPFGVKIREARDSANHPKSLGIIVGLDETGSMDVVPDYLIREKLGTLVEVMLKNGVEDPAILMMGVGDYFCDSAPLQVGQFESGATELNECLSKIYLEGNGGGNGGEGYIMPWYFAALHTSIDCFEKRNQKGFLFTIGDEPPHLSLPAEKIKQFIGDNEVKDMTADQLLNMARRMYEVYHIHITETGSRRGDRADTAWRELLGENLIMCDDKDMVAEIIASTVALRKGADLKNILGSFDATTAGIVAKAIGSISPGSASLAKDPKPGIMKL